MRSIIPYIEFLTNLVSSAGAVQGTGMATPKIYFYDDPRRIWYAGGKISWWQGWVSHIGVREPDAGQHDCRCDKEYVSGCCMLVRRRLIQQGRLLDPAYPHH